MRITVGHVILVSVIGGSLLWKGTGAVEWVSKTSTQIISETKTFLGLAEGNKAPSPKVDDLESPVKTGPERVAGAVEGYRPPAKAVPMGGAPEGNAPASAQAKAAPAPEPVVAQKAPQKKKAVAQKRAQKKKTRRASRKKQSAKAANKTPHADLIGSYVQIELATGRTVKGVLRDVSAKELTVELPGLGPFKYPRANVKSVKAAE